MKTEKKLKACSGCGNLFMPINKFRDFCCEGCRGGNCRESYIIENANNIGINLPNGGHAESSICYPNNATLIGYSSGI